MKRDPISLLLTMGSTLDEVKETLEEKNIKGSRYKAHSCPIANYLRQETGRKVDVTSGLVTIYRSKWSQFFNLSPKQVQPPAAVREFIYEFDLGHLPSFVKR